MRLDVGEFVHSWHDGAVTPPDIRLIAIDLDGTLLDSQKRLDPDFPELLHTLQERGITVVPASGRQHESIRRAVSPGSSPETINELAIIAENGAMVTNAGEVVSLDPVSRETLDAMLDVVAAESAAGRNTGLVYCGSQAAYIERDDPEFRAATDGYYPIRTTVKDLRSVQDVPLKLSIWDADGAEKGIWRAIRHAAPDDTRTLVSAPVWIDVMSPTADKGHALGDLQESLGITPAQTMVFGDYGNDIGMLGKADWSFAMGEAHPDVKKIANYQAPSNDDQGVTRTIREILEL